MKRLPPAQVEQELARLGALDTKSLQRRWRDLYQTEPPPRIRAPLLRRFIAYRLQVLAFGGLKPKTIRRLRKLADEQRATRMSKLSASDQSEGPLRMNSLPKPTLSVGTQLLREWSGSTEIVDVTTNGLVWRGRTFATLSAVATAVTGTKWSAPRFFGLRSNSSTKPKAPATQSESER